MDWDPRDDYPDEEEYYRALFGDEVKADELNHYAAWLSPGLAAAEQVRKSASRTVICGAMAGLTDYTLYGNGYPHLKLSQREMLEAIVPPRSDPAWGGYPRPRTLFHQLHRMAGEDKSGKPVDLIKPVPVPREHESDRPKTDYKLTRTGICYAHICGAATKDDLVRYWRHEAHGQPAEPTNGYYLALVGKEPPPDTSIYRYQTPGAGFWESLASLALLDETVPDRYQNVSASKLGKALTDVHGNKAAEAMKVLTQDDQRALCHDVLIGAEVDNEAVRDEIIDGLYRKDITYEDRVEKLVRYYKRGDKEPDAERIVMELICRSAWAVVRTVMDYRMADDQGSPTRHPSSQPVKPVTTEQALEAIEKLDSVLGSFAISTGAQQSGYEGEWEIDTTNRPTGDGDPF